MAGWDVAVLGAAASQMRAWQASLAHMHLVLVDPEIPADTGVGIEYQIPQTAKRIDVLLSGRDDTNTDRVVIVELKQWQDAKSTPLDGVVRTLMGGALVHPCAERPTHLPPVIDAYTAMAPISPGVVT